MSRQECISCEGEGLTRSEDWDEEGVRVIMVRCEDCAGEGQLVDCGCCDRPMPPPLAEEGGGLCGWCRAEGERGDAEAEIARIRAWSP